MQVFRGRPLAFACCFAAAMAVLALWLSGNVRLILLAALLATGAVLSAGAVLRRRLGERTVAAILCCAMSACLLLGSWFWFSLRTARYVPGSTATAEGYVTERLQSRGGKSRFAVRLTVYNGERVRDSVLLECAYRSALQEGDSFRLTGTVRAFERDADYDEERYLQADGLLAVLTCADAQTCTVTGHRSNVPIALRGVRLGLRERLRAAIGGEEGALASALLLGDRSLLDGQTTLAFRRGGVSHLLALSGLHVSILIGIVSFLLQRLHFSKRIRTAFVPPLAVFYLLVTGCAVSTARAVLMVTVLSLAFFWAERYDPFTALSVALFGILAVTPYAVLDASLWLSFSAAASIVVFLPVCRSLFRKRLFTAFLPAPLSRLLKGLITAVMTGSFASSGILAVSVAFTGSASVLSMPLTLVLSPVVTAALLTGLLTLLLPVAPVAAIARLCLRVMLSLTGWAAELAHVLILPTHGVEWLLLWASLALTVATAILPLRRKGWTLLPALFSAAFLLIGFCGVLTPQETVASYCRSTSGETVLITGGRHAALIDVTDGSARAVRNVTRLLEDAGLTELDDLVFSHYHSRAPVLLRQYASRIRVRRLWLPDPQTPEEQAIAARLAEEAVRCGVEPCSGTPVPAVPQTELLRLEHIGGVGAEASVGFSLRVGEERLTALSAQLITDPSWQERYPILLESDTLLILSHGKTATGTQALRLPECVWRVVWSNSDVAAHCPAVAMPPYWYVDIDHIRFEAR